MIGFLLASLASLGQEALPGRVVFAGAGAALDASLCADLAPSGRVVLDLSADGRAEDPMEAGGPPLARFAVGGRDDSRDVADAVLGAPCVVLAGGGAIDWYHRLFPRGHPSRLAAAIREAHAGGATVVGAGASAPYLASFAMVAWSDLGKTRRNPRRVRDDVAVQGLGLVEGFLLDSAARPRGDPARALRAAFDGFLDTVLFLDGPIVFVADSKARSGRFLGKGWVLLVDLKTARRNRGSLASVRLSVLAAGDAWSDRGGPICAGSTAATTVPVNARFDAIRSALARDAVRVEVFADERTRVRAPEACAELGFDLAWDRNGS